MTRRTKRRFAHELYPLAEAHRHRHWTPRDAHGCKVLIETVQIPESECPECTDGVEER